MTTQPYHTPTSSTKPTSCPNWIGILFNEAQARTLIASCKRWPCEYCGPRKASALFHRVKNGKFKYKADLTAPSPKPGDDPEQVYRAFNGAKKTVMQWFRRHAIVGRDKFWVNEFGHKNGQLHCHLILDVSWFSYNKLKAALGNPHKRKDLNYRHKSISGIGWNVEFRKVRSIPKVVNYLIKYLVKDITAETVLGKKHPRYLHRYHTTIPREKIAQLGQWLFQIRDRGLAYLERTLAEGVAMGLLPLADSEKLLHEAHVKVLTAPPLTPIWALK